jgi:hypothetical protein
MIGFPSNPSLGVTGVIGGPCHVAWKYENTMGSEEIFSSKHLVLAVDPSKRHGG